MRKDFIAAASLLAASIAMANPAASQTPTAVQSQSPAHQAAASELAEAIVPDSSIEEQVDSMLSQLFDQLFASDPDFIELERAIRACAWRYPNGCVRCWSSRQ